MHSRLLKYFRRHILHLTLLLSLCLAAPVASLPAEGAAKTSRSATAKKSSAKKKASSSKKVSSAKKSSSSRRSSSGASSSRRRSSTARQTATVSTDAPQAPATTAPTPTRTASASKRKIKVAKPDLDSIRQRTLDPKSPRYFPKLMAKYNRNDTTMTTEEYRDLYLGYMFQEDYDPYRTSIYSGRTDDLRLKATHSKEEIDTIRKYAELALKDNPFDLRQMAFLVHVLKEKRKDMSAKIWEYRLEHLLGAIKSTGTGEDTENAWYVIYPMHEYDLIQVLGYEATDADFIEPGYDYLTVSPLPETAKKYKDKVQKGFYFNVIPVQEQYALKHPEDLLQEETDEEEVLAL